MRACSLFLLIIVCSFGCSYLIVTLLDFHVSLINVDQPIASIRLYPWAARWAALISCWMLAVETLFLSPRLLESRPPPAIFIFLFLAVLVSLIAVMAIILGFASILLQRIDVIGREWQLQSRSGYAYYLGIVYGLEYCGIIFSGIGISAYYRIRGKLH